MNLFCVIIILIVLTCIYCKSIIEIENGYIRGTSGISAKGRKFDSFLGVRYGYVSQRFKVAIPPDTWIGVWDATKFGNDCLQLNYVTENPKILGSEDCLFLNVYTPKLPKNNTNPLMDVIVFIHGGAFMFGAPTMYGPELLMDRDVVFVTINYRLGPLGFLSTEDEVLPGNMGLKDQVLALAWIQQNIKYFGGNPESVTISGCSAGGASVHYHYISPLSKGLFQKGISLSGTVLQPWCIQEAAREKANLLGDSLGCPTKNSKILIECLRERPANQIVEIVDKLLFWKYNPFSPFGPVVEKYGKYPFISEEPIDALMAGNFLNNPWLTSITASEGLFPGAVFITNSEEANYVDHNWNKLAAHLLDYNYTLPLNQHEYAAQKIKEYYFPKKGFTDRKQIDGFIKMLSDRLFNLDAARSAIIHASSGDSPVYFYRFSYRGANSLSDHLTHSKIDLGASHVDDSCYVLNCSFLNTGETEDDLKMRELMLDIWLNFAKSKKNVYINDFKWESLLPEQIDFQFLDITNPQKISMQSESNFGSPDLWDTLPFNEAQIKFPLNSKNKDEL